MTYRLLFPPALFLLMSLAAPTPAAGQLSDEPDPVVEAELHRLESEYTQAVIEHHAARRSARSLLAAAILTGLQPWRDAITNSDSGHADFDASDHDPRHADARRLYERAFERGGDDPLVLWTIANQGYRDDLRGMAVRAAQRLTVVDEDNAAVWLLQLHLDADALTDVETDALLARAAASAGHRTYYADSVRFLADAYSAVPRAEALVALEPLHPAFASAVQSDRSAAFMRAFGVAMAASTPSAASAGEACRAPEAGSARQDNCLRLARLLAGHSDTLMGQHIGLGLWERLTVGTPAHAEVVSRRRIADWQREAYGEVVQSAHAPEWSLVEQAWAANNDEFGVIHAVLESAGVALLPPDDFSSARQAWLQKEKAASKGAAGAK